MEKWASVVAALANPLSISVSRGGLFLIVDLRWELVDSIQYLVVDGDECDDLFYAGSWGVEAYSAAETGQEGGNTLERSLGLLCLLPMAFHNYFFLDFKNFKLNYI